MEQFYGLLGAPAVRELVELIKPAWSGSKIGGLLNVLSSMVLGVILNISIALGAGTSLTVAVGMGVATGLLSNVWNTIVDVSKQ